MKTAVLVVSHNTCADTLACLECLVSSGAPPESIFVADNASTDGTAGAIARSFAGVRLIVNPTNDYYARALNQLLAAARADYYLLLNPDTRPDFRALTRLLDGFAAHPRRGAIAPQLRFPDGRIQPSCRRFPDWRTPWRELIRRGQARHSIWKMADFDHDATRPVDQPMFSCIWIRGRAIEDVGMLDTRYPLFFNDVDWCLRARSKGWEIWFDPSVQLTHALGGTTGLYPWRKLRFAHTGFARFLWRTRADPLTGVIGVAGAWTTLLVRAFVTLFKQ
jgi:N-acetylglucosaminyl-diphospho-decaprenol L-rhamnosyltransferase